MRWSVKACPASTKENSPIWDMLKAEIMAVRMEYPVIFTTGTSVKSFMAKIRAAMERTIKIWEMKKSKFNNIPTEMKKILVKISLNGRTFSIMLTLYSDSARSKPAINAPKERDKPIEAVIRATEKQNPRTVMSISSRERVLTTANMRRGKMNLPNRITPIMTREFSPMVIRLSCRDNSNFPLRSGKRSMIGTMTRSWKMRIARQTLPCGESDWAFCWKRLKTMAVEERVTKQPKATAFCHGNTAENIAVISKIVKLICPNPPIKRGRFIRFKSLRKVPCRW